MIFQDRKDAGQKLAAKLAKKYPKMENGLILALPRGGVVVGAEIAKILSLPWFLLKTVIILSASPKLVLLMIIPSVL